MSHDVQAASTGRRRGPDSAGWRERYWDDDPEFERKEFLRLARDIMEIQATVRKCVSAHGVPHPIQRAFHAKSTLASDDAELRFHDDLPPDLRVGFAQPGATYRTTVRFSNAAGRGAPDFEPDLRGVALRVLVDESVSHDLLATNFPVSHARDARQFVEFAKAFAGSGISKVVGFDRLVRLYDLPETIRMIRNLRRARSQPVHSVASQTYWSRGAMTWGPLAVRYLLRPCAGTPIGPAPSTTDPSYLSNEAAVRLEAADVRFELCIQRFVDEAITPIEDTSVEWTEAHSPAEPVATLTLRRADVRTPDAQARQAAVDELAFNPWNTTTDFRPLGNLNRARKGAYDASAAHRSQTRWLTTPPARNVIIGRLARILFTAVNRWIPWYRLPVRSALLNLEVFRTVLREQNLIDTETHEAPPRPRRVPASPPEGVRMSRTPDGSYNDLSAPSMGAVGATFGRNLPVDRDHAPFDEPNPITVSNELLSRTHFIPARSLSLLAAAWIQFQVHDWVRHDPYKLGERDIIVPLPASEKSWQNIPDGPAEPRMRIAGNKALEEAPDGTGLVFANTTTHWWDASELYGSDAAKTESLREGAKIRLDDGYLPHDGMGQAVTGFNESWWLGLSALHTLFAREHNAVCDALRAEYRGWSDERVFQTARLVLAALIAKIHTVEWTPAILATEPIDIGLKGNWSGPPSNDWLTRLGIWLIDVHAGVGIPRTKPDHHGIPFSLTEDFVTVYRMHPLIPDDYRFLDHHTGHRVADRTFLQIAHNRADRELRELHLDNVLYSFGIAHPGAITLHNYPESLRRFQQGDAIVDLAVADIVRTRRRGVPRYNDFRAGLHKPRIRDWKQLSEDPDTAALLEDVYGSVDRVDTMVGLFAETPPEGFGFSDTAFRIFILMASRRIQSDRFLTVDFRPEVYSPLGMDWVQQNTFSSVILRHCPDLAALLPRDRSPFAPWRPVGGC